MYVTQPGRMSDGQYLEPGVRDPTRRGDSWSVLAPTAESGPSEAGSLEFPHTP
jgi:hypothetical protein